MKQQMSISSLKNWIFQSSLTENSSFESIKFYNEIGQESIFDQSLDEQFGDDNYFFLVYFLNLFLEVFLFFGPTLQQLSLLSYKLGIGFLNLKLYLFDYLSYQLELIYYSYQKLELLSIIFIEEMFYSPSKEFLRYTTYKTAQIKTLKDRLTKQKVSEEELHEMRGRIDMLKNQNDILQQQNHSELKTVLQNTQEALHQLNQKKKLQERQISFKKSQAIDMEEIQKQLQIKRGKVKLMLFQQRQDKSQMDSQKQQNQNKIQQLREKLMRTKLEVKQEEELKNDVDKAEKDLQLKWEELQENIKNVSSEKINLQNSIELSKQKISQVSQQFKFQEQQIEITKLKIEKSIMQQKHSMQKFQRMQVEKIKNQDNKIILEGQLQQSKSLNKMISMITGQNSVRQSEEIQVQKKIKQVVKKLTLEEQKKCQWEQQISVMKANIDLLKGKNQNLKNKLSTIFASDNDLIGCLLNKKIHQSVNVTTNLKQNSTKMQGKSVEKQTKQLLAERSLNEMRLL